MSQKSQYINSPLRGFKYADEEFKNNFLKINEQALKRAKSKLSNDEYDKFFHTLYNYNLYKASGMEDEHPEIGQSQQTLNDYFNKQADELNFMVDNAPDFDDDGNYIESDSTYTPEQWNVYERLDDEGKKEFANSIRKGKEIKQDQYDTYHRLAGAIPIVGGLYDAIGNIDSVEDYLKGKIDTSKNAVNKENAETLEMITQRFYNRLTGSDDYKEAVKNTTSAIVSDLMNQGMDSEQLESVINDSFISAMKENRVLAGASGNGGKSFEETDKDKAAFDYYDYYTEQADNATDPEEKERMLKLAESYKNDIDRIKATRDRRSAAFEKLMDENPEFRLEYLANVQTLDSLLKSGKITEEDYRGALENIAENALADKTTWYNRWYNAGKGALVTAATYSIQKAASIAMHAYMRAASDGSVFMNSDGKIYSDNDVYNMGTIKEDGSFDVYLDENKNIVPRESIVLDYDNKPVTDEFGNYYVKIDDDGSYTSDGNVDDLNQNPERYKTVRMQNIKDTNIGTGAIYSMGYYDDGTEIHVALNPKYLSYASQYNVMPTDKDELDYYNKYGYSPSVSMVHPGESKRDYVAETVKMGGFMLSDMMFQNTIGRIPYVGGVINGTLSAGAIAEAYRQGVFEEAYNDNLGTLNDRKASTLNSQTNDYLLSHKEELESYIDSSIQNLKEKNPDIQITDAVYNNVRNLAIEQFKRNIYNKLESEYDSDPRRTDEARKAVESASMAADADFIGEAVKYGAVNFFGHRAWLFKRKSVAAANTKQLFGETVGKRLERWSTATAEDVAVAENKIAKLNAERTKLIDKLKNSGKPQKSIDKGIAEINKRFDERISRMPSKVGDSFVKGNWDMLSKGQKAESVAGSLISQAWGGGWTNDTDEIQSSMSKALSSALFKESIKDPESDGVSLGLLFNANVIGAQYNALFSSAINPNTLAAGGVGAAGSLFGSPNIVGIMKLATTRSGREQWKNMSDAEKLHTIWSNGITADISEKINTDREAHKLIEFTNKIINQTAQSKEDLFKVIGLGSLAGTESSYIRAAENDIELLANTINSANDFVETNEAIAAQDIAQSINDFRDTITKISDIENQDDETRNAFIEQIKVMNPNMTASEAEAELSNVVKKATAASKLINAADKLFQSKEYKFTINQNKKKSMYRNLVLNHENEYILDKINELENNISGNSFNSESLHNSLNSDIFNDTQSIPLQTLKLRKEAMQDVLDNELMKQKEALENEIAELQGKKGNTREEREEIRDNYEAAKTHLEIINSKINSIKEQIDYISPVVEKRSEAADKDNIDATSFYPAESILKFNPIVRSIYLDEDNAKLFTNKQVAEIERAKQILKNKNISIDEVNAVPVMMQRYANRTKEISIRESALNKGDNIDFTEEYRISNAMNTVSRIVDLSVIKELSSKKAELKNSIHDKDAYRESLISLYKNYNASKLKQFKDRIEFADDTDIIDDILKLRTTAESVARTIAIKQAAEELSAEEAKSLNTINNSMYGISDNKDTYIDKISEFAGRSSDFKKIIEEATGVVINTKATVDTTETPAEKSEEGVKAEKAEEDASKIMEEESEHKEESKPEETKEEKTDTDETESDKSEEEESKEESTPLVLVEDTTTFPTPTTKTASVSEIKEKEPEPEPVSDKKEEPEQKKEPEVKVSESNQFKNATSFSELSDLYVQSFMKQFPGTMDDHPENVEAIKKALAEMLPITTNPFKDLFDLTIGKKDDNPVYPNRMDFSRVTQPDFMKFVSSVKDDLKEMVVHLSQKKSTPGEVKDNVSAEESKLESAKEEQPSEPNKETEETPDNLKSVTDTLKESFMIAGEGIPTAIQQSESTDNQNDTDSIKVVNKADNNKFRSLEADASFLKGNVMSKYEVKEADAGRMVVKVPNPPTGTLARYNAWMEANGFNLQEFIDEKFIDVLNSHKDGSPVDLKIMLTTNKNNAYGDNTVIQNRFLVTEYTPEVAAVYTEKDFEKYGKPIKSDSEGSNKKYIIVGVLGWAGSNANQRASVTDNIDPIIYGGRNAYFNNPANKDKRFYVHPGMHTNVRHITAGYMPCVQNGPDVNILDLIKDSSNTNSNPFNYTISSLEFGIQLDENNFLMCNDDLQNDVSYVRPAKYKKNTGAVYVFVRGGNGKHFPRKIAPITAVDLVDGSKLKSDVNNALNELKSLDFETRKKAWKRLRELLVMDKDNKVSFGDEDKPVIVFTKNGAKQVFKLTEKDKWSDAEFEKAFYDLNLLVSVTKHDLENITKRKALAEAGALKVNTSKLGLFDSDFIVYNINTATGDPVITDSTIKPNTNIPERKAPYRQVIQNNAIYKVYEDSTKPGGFEITDEFGNSVSEDTWTSVYYQHLINIYGFTPNQFFTEKGNFEYYTVMLGNNFSIPTILQRNLQTGEIKNITGTDKGVSIHNSIIVAEAKFREQEEINARNAAAEEMLKQAEQQEVSSTETESVTFPTFDDSDVNTVTAAMDLLSGTGKGQNDTQRSETQTPPSPPLPAPVSETVPAPQKTKLEGTGKNLTEILENDADMTIINILDGVLHFDDNDTLEDMVRKCNEAGIQTENISDINTWLKYFKC